MWLLEYVRSGFAADAPDLPFALFRIVLALACCTKFALETRRKHFRHFRPDSYLYFAYRVRKPRFLITPHWYRLVYVAKIPAALLLLAGVMPRLSLLILAIAFAVDLQVQFKNHTSLLFLMSAILLLSPSCGRTLTLPGLVQSTGDAAAWVNDSAAARVDPFAAVAIVLTVAVMYVATAVHKMNPVFLGGASVYSVLASFGEQRHARAHFDTFLPAWFRRYWLEADEDTLRRRWAPLMWTTVALELLLPFALLVPALQPAAVVAGVLMHVAFTLLNPSALLSFTLVTLGTYVFFIDPARLAALVVR